MASVSGFRKALAEKFDDEIRFFKGWMDRPKAVGSIVPTSSVTARRMASIVDPHVGTAGARGRARHRRDHARDPGARREARKPLRGRVFRRFRAAPASALPAASTSSRAMLSISTRRSANLREQKFDSVVSGVPLLNFPVAAPRRLSRRPARPYPARPADRAAHLRSRNRRCRRARATTLSSISTSSSATSRRRSCGSTGGRPEIEPLREHRRPTAAAALICGVPIAYSCRDRQERSCRHRENSGLRRLDPQRRLQRQDRRCRDEGTGDAGRRRHPHLARRLSSADPGPESGKGKRRPRKRVEARPSDCRP